MLKKIKIIKPYNIIKKLKGCLNCHKIKSEVNYKDTNLIEIKIKTLYNKMYNIKNFKNFNLIMNNILINLKNKYILEISKYFNKIIKFKEILFINEQIWRW
ncbi:hypothetical protein CA212_138 [Candidatus Nasuia deltocephalinicola]|nr:hypothetical protein CA212_138 [Candidatus Nasuia deltocephalinicola]